MCRQSPVRQPLRDLARGRSRQIAGHARERRPGTLLDRRCRALRQVSRLGHFLGSSLPNPTNCCVMSQQIRPDAPAGSRVRVGSVPTASVLRALGYLIDVE